MAIPLFKIFFTMFRYASKPLNTILIKALKNKGRKKMLMRRYIEKFGQYCHRMEVKLNRTFIGDENPLIPVDH